jgi:D-alanyl-D-alanine carboxypeptidase (penicillin-binding protein 5/6)
MRITKYFMTILLLCAFLLKGNVVSSSPNIKGEIALLIEGTTKTVLYEKNSGMRVTSSGPVNIMTALLGLERGYLHDRINISNGDELSLEDLIYGVLLEDNNHLNSAIASHIGGSIPRFVDMMNIKAKEIGALSTYFPSTDEEPYTTAGDLALIVISALQNTQFSNIIKASSWEWTSGGERRSFVNRNPLIGKYQGLDGVKAGGGYLIASATRDGQQLLVVIINSADAAGDARLLLDYGFENYQLYNFVNHGDLLKTISVKDGVIKKVGLVAARDLNIVLPCDLHDASLEEIIEIRAEIKAPIQRWEVLGQYKVLLDQKEIGSVELLSDSQVIQKSIAHTIKEWFLLFINLFG